MPGKKKTLKYSYLHFRYKTEANRCKFVKVPTRDEYSLNR